MCQDGKLRTDKHRTAFDQWVPVGSEHSVRVIQRCRDAVSNLRLLRYHSLWKHPCVPVNAIISDVIPKKVLYAL